MTPQTSRLTAAHGAWTIAIIILALAGFALFSQFGDYTYLSDDNVDDILKAKLWTLGWLSLSAAVIYFLRRRSFAPALAVFALSAYLVGYYGFMFYGTEYGMNGHWGDNGNRMAEICKMMAYGSFFQDWYLKDLPSFYPPLWFALMALYAKALSLEAYQTVKWGYLLIALVYPWLLYASWIRLVGRTTAALVTLAVIFFGMKYLDWVYYEHMTAALFIPWWLYYFENALDRGGRLRERWTFYALGGLFGALLFMTYYYWFFMAFAALPLTVALRYRNTRSWAVVGRDLAHKAALLGVVALFSAVYWLPLLRRIYWWGAESAQNVWFGIRHADLTHQWDDVTVEGALIVAGLFAAGVLWKKWNSSPIAALIAGGFIVLLLDRWLPLYDTSVQSRKVLEFLHVFALTPLAVAAGEMGGRALKSESLKRGGLVALFTLAVVVANKHTELYDSPLYRIAINQRVPEADLAPFAAVETDNTVFLTNRYLEACYLPYYLFIPLNNMTAHTAGRYSQRKSFLERAISIKEAELLAYALAYNRYSPVDFVYLPRTEETGQLQLKLSVIHFLTRSTVRELTFAAEPDSAPDFFALRHPQGIYQILPPPRSTEMDERLRVSYPEIVWHLQPWAAQSP